MNIVKKQAGGLVLTAVIAMAVTGVVGLAAGIGVIERSAGCSQVFNSDDATAEDIERCRNSFPEQFAIAVERGQYAAGQGSQGVSQFVLRAVNNRIITQATMIASSPSATQGNAFPSDVQGDSDGGSGNFTVLSYQNFDGSMSNLSEPGFHADLADIQVFGNVDFPLIDWTGPATVDSIGAIDQQGVLVYGIQGEEREDEEGNIETLFITTRPVQYGDYGVASSQATDSSRQPSPALLAGQVYSFVVQGSGKGATVSVRKN